MKGRIKWVEGRTFLGESGFDGTGSSHAVVIDGPKAAGGRDLGPSPMELVLLGAGGCTSFDVVSILQKGRHDVRGCELVLEAERAATAPRVFTAIKMHFIIEGRDLNPGAVERAVVLSLERYCSATAMLGRTASISHSLEIRQSKG